MSHWYDSVIDTGTALIDEGEMVAEETPGVGTLYHGAQSAYHAAGALGTVAEAELTGDYSQETQNVAIDQAGEAGAQAIESIPFLDIVLDGGNALSGGELHEDLKKDVISDTMGDDYKDAPDTPEAKDSTLNTVGDMLFKPWWAQL